MNNEIRPGDLVMVVRPTTCCGSMKSIGTVFEVAEIGNYFCHCVLYNFAGNGIAALVDAESGYPIQRLKKLNPPAEQEIIEREKEIA